MPTPPMSETMLKESVDLVKQYGSIRSAAKAAGINRKTLQSRVNKAREMWPDCLPNADLSVWAKEEADFSIPDLPDEGAPIEELIAARVKAFQRKQTAKESRQLIPVKVNIDGAYGLLHFGDPHIDDDGCDWPTLQHHLDLVDRTEGLFGINVGDSSNNWVGRLARLYANQSTTATDSIRLVEWLIGRIKWMAIIGGNHDCLDIETEALTLRGWVKHHEIRHDDHVLGLDVKTGEAIWQPILQKIERSNSENMVCVKARGLDMSVTRNHRVLCSTRDGMRKWRPLEYVAAANLPKRFRIPAAGNRKNGSVILSDEQIALAGWILTDGSIQRLPSPRVSLWQSKDGSEIERLLSACRITYKKLVREREISAICGVALKAPTKPQVEYRVGAHDARKIMAWVPQKGELPSWAWELNDRQFDILLGALVAGDGSWASNGLRSACVIHGERAFLDSVQAIAVQHGWRASISIARGKDARLNLCRNTMIECEDRVSIGEPSPTVWCLTVPLTNFMVRRNGRAYFTGNCWSGAGDPIKWFSRNAGSLYEWHGLRLALQSPNGCEVRLNARHDFAGTSQWNGAHAPAKAARMGWARDHLYTCGHRHMASYNFLVFDNGSHVAHAVRVGTYKVYDDFAESKGFPRENLPACLTVHNPNAKTPAGLVTVFWDVDEGADYLRFLRRPRIRVKAA